MSTLLIDECKNLLDVYYILFEANEHNCFSILNILCESGRKRIGIL